MTTITTHVLDTARGRPAVGMSVRLERRVDAEHWLPIGRGETDRDGRLLSLMTDLAGFTAAVYRLIFDTGAYYSAQRLVTLYPSITIEFETAPGEARYHVPLLLSPFGYSTYRGS